MFAVRKYLPLSQEDLRSVGDQNVRKRIMELVRNELEWPSESNSLEGFIAGRPGVMYRRAIPRSDRHVLDDEGRHDGCDESSRSACDFVVVYRLPTRREISKYRLPRLGAVVIERVVPNSEIAQQVAERYGQR